MSVIEFRPREPKPADDSHNSGKARCLDCTHEWVAVAPGGTTWLECPQCKTFKGRYLGPCQRAKGADHWHCACGNDLFHAMREGVYCPCCGEWQQFPCN